MKNIIIGALDFFDPYRRGPFFTRFGVTGILFLAAATVGLYFWVKAPATILGPVFHLLTLGVHEIGHPLFRTLFAGNHFMTIIGGTAMEIIVPVFTYLYFLRKGWEIQSDVCLLLLSIAFKSIGFYSGYTLEAVVLVINGDENTTPDWDFMHKWFGTEGQEYAVCHFFYWLSAFVAALAVWMLIQHIKRWSKEGIYSQGNTPA